MALNYCGQEPETQEFSVIKVPLSRIKAIWKHAEDLILAGLSVAPELRINDIIDGLSDESIQMWIVTDGGDIIATFLTSIENDRGDWVVSLYALGGSQARDWLNDCDIAMEVFARQEGAKRIRMAGRKAWQRLLPATYAITGVRGGHNVYERPVS